MKKLKEIFFVLMARVESERVSNKMLREFAGTSLWEVACEKFSKTKNIPEFYVSVRNDRLKEIGEKYGAKIWRRSEESTCEPNTPSGVLDWYNFALENGYKYFVYMNPSCSSLTSVSKIENFIETFISSKNESLFSVFKKQNFCWTIEDKKINTLTKFSGTEEEKATLESKLVQTRFESANLFYAGLIDNIKKNKTFGNWTEEGDPEFFIVDLIEAFDIDEMDQFLLAEYMYRLKNERIKHV